MINSIKFKVVSVGKVIKIGGLQGARSYICKDEKGRKYQVYARSKTQAIHSLNNMYDFILKSHRVK